MKQRRLLHPPPKLPPTNGPSESYTSQLWPLPPFLLPPPLPPFPSSDRGAAGSFSSEELAGGWDPTETSCFYFFEERRRWILSPFSSTKKALPPGKVFWGINHGGEWLIRYIPIADVQCQASTKNTAFVEPNPFRVPFSSWCRERDGGGGKEGPWD